MKTQGDLLVIGAGPAGLTAGWQAAADGEKVCVIAKGWGATHWLPGCVDVLGFYPLDSKSPVKSPAKALKKLIHEQPRHPYALIGVDRLHEALAGFLQQRTTIIIAHRLSAVKQADRVYVFEDGHVVEEGAHAELIRGEGLYQRLYGHMAN